MRARSTAIASLCLALVLVIGTMDAGFAFIVQDRPLPADGVLGVFKPSALPKFVIDNKVVELSAGTQIRNQNNVIVQTESIKGADVHVLYQKNKFGQIERIWMLTDEEYERIKSGVKPKLLPGTKAAPSPNH